MNDGISIFTACMNRNKNLKACISSWLNSPDVVEIVIVDWGSKTPVHQTLYTEISTDPRIKIILVEGVFKWCLSWAFNLAAKFTTQNKLLKLDCDNLLHPEFILQHTLTRGTFFTGNWKNATPGNVNELSLNGVMYVYRADFFKVGGYNEFIQCYGWDDSDLYERLESTGLVRYDINNKYIEHLPHTLEERSSKNTFHDIHYNRYLCSLDECKWDRTQRGCAFETKSIVPGDLCREIRHATLLSFPLISEENKQYAERKVQEFMDYQSTISYPLHPDFNHMFINVRNGLGNKMRALASAYNLFLRLGDYSKIPWHLHIIWEPDDHCMARFEDLFDLNSLGPHRNRIFVLSKRPKLPKDMLKLEDGKISDETWAPRGIDMFLKTIKESSKSVTIYIESATVIYFPGSDWWADCRFLKMLIPAEKPKGIIDSLLRKYPDIGKAVGVHVRLGQPQFEFDDVSNWSEDKKKKWEYWRSKSNVSAFVKRMRNMISENSDQKFYFASDTLSLYKLMKDEFGDRIMSYERIEEDRSIDQVITAIVDVYMLSKTKSMLASNWSSFSELVKRLNNFKMEIAGKDF